MPKKNPNDVTDAEIREAASETVSEGTDIRSRVHDITLRALQSRRFDRDGIRDVVRAVTEGTALGADRKHTGMRQAMSEALQGLDQAMRTSADAGGQALKELSSSGRGLSDTELKEVLGTLRKMQTDFLHTGATTGKQVAVTMGEFAQKFGAASFEATLTGLETAADVGQRFSLIASGILSGMSEALRTEPKTDGTEPRER